MNSFNGFNVGDLVEIFNDYNGPYKKGEQLVIRDIQKYENICATLKSDSGYPWNYPLDCKWRIYLKVVEPISLENI